MKRISIILLALGLAAGCSKSKSPSPAAPNAAATAAGGSPAPQAAPVAASPADCRACELHSKNKNCNPAYLTAQHDKDDNAVADTFGCGTLGSQAARESCAALLTCINKNRCAMNPVTKTAPGDNPVVGCYCGPKTDAKDCLGGTGISGPCVSQYHAAATATEGGPKADAKESDFAAFIGPRAFDATSAVGLADNIFTCAYDAPCPACGGL